jgi:hypothetical protein
MSTGVVACLTDGKEGKGQFEVLAGREAPYLIEAPIVWQANAPVGPDVSGIMPSVIEADRDYVVLVGLPIQEVEQSIDAVTIVSREGFGLPVAVPGAYYPATVDLEQEPPLLARAEARDPQLEVVVLRPAGSPDLAVPLDLCVQ